MAARRKIAEKYAQKYLGCTNLEELQYLGSGSYAEAFKVGGSVLKITKDKHDAVLSNRLIGKNYENVVTTKRVVAFECEDEGTLYIMETEFLDTLYGDNRDKYKIVRDFIDDASPNN